MEPSIAKDLNLLLSDYQVFYQKLRGYHWNVTGPLFFGLHEKFEELYLDAANKVDDLAERLAAGGQRPASTLREQLGLARLEESDRNDPNEMVRDVVTDLEKLDGFLRATASQSATAGDPATANLLEGFADGQEKTAWMLRAFLSA